MNKKRRRNSKQRQRARVPSWRFSDLGCRYNRRRGRRVDDKRDTRII